MAERGTADPSRPSRDSYPEKANLTGRFFRHECGFLTFSQCAQRVYLMPNFSLSLHRLDQWIGLGVSYR